MKSHRSTARQSVKAHRTPGTTTALIHFLNQTAGIQTHIIALLVLINQNTRKILEKVLVWVRIRLNLAGVIVQGFWITAVTELKHMKLTWPRESFGKRTDSSEHICTKEKTFMFWHNVPKIAHLGGKSASQI